MKVRALIADDEESARSRLRKLLAEHPCLLIEGEARDGIETLQAIQRVRPDVVFLDVQMPGLNGFEVLNSLAADARPLIVFATAYDEYALAAFEANAVAYLLKPINRDRLALVLERVERLLQKPADLGNERSRLTALASATRQTLQHIVAVQRDRYLLVSLSDVCFFQVEDGITRVKTSTALYRTNYAIGDLDERLPSPPFFRAHRSIIVNMDMVAEISALFKGSFLLKMKDSQASEVQVSERQSKFVRGLLQL